MCVSAGLLQGLVPFHFTTLDPALLPPGISPTPPPKMPHTLSPKGIGSCYSLCLPHFVSVQLLCILQNPVEIPPPFYEIFPIRQLAAAFSLVWLHSVPSSTDALFAQTCV